MITQSCNYQYFHKKLNLIWSVYFIYYYNYKQIKMGLGKKLGQMNATANTQVAQANAPLAENGFNVQNIPNLQPTPITREDVSQINQLAQEARNDYAQIQQNQFNLQKPTVPQGQEYPNHDVSVLVVEKMWRIVCLKKLHGFYTQNSLQNLVNRACKHDYKTLMTQWGLPTLDMAVDLAVLGLYDIIIFGDDPPELSIPQKFVPFAIVVG